MPSNVTLWPRVFWVAEEKRPHRHEFTRMQLTLLLALAMVAYAFTRTEVPAKPFHPGHRNWAQNLFAGLAVIAALLILLNPEFLSLGLIGDAAFFDLLVLLITLQFQMIAARVWGIVGSGFASVLLWLTTRSLGYFLILSAFLHFKTTIQKIAQRVFSDFNCAA